MPELPEVEVVRAGLAPAVTGARIVAVTVADERALTRHSGSGADFEARLTGRTLAGAARRGKFLWLPLSSPEEPGESLVGHLGMSGQLLLRASGARRSRLPVLRTSRHDSASPRAENIRTGRVRPVRTRK